MKIAVLSNMMEFLPGYSLTGIIKDQLTMLKKYGHDVHLFVNSQYHGESFAGDIPVRKSIPFTHLIDYKSIKDLSPEHKMIVNQTAGVLEKELADFDLVFTHDFVFTGWFMPYGLACQETGNRLPKLRWLHWIHSVPSASSDWWDIRRYGNQHKLVYPNETDKVRVAEQYRGAIENVRIIPHIKDLRSWFDFDPETIEFIDHYPAVMQADIVQILPASVDRLTAKRVREVIIIFSAMKKLGLSVCLVIANQWATTRTHKENVEKYKALAVSMDLDPAKEVIFTSDYKEGQFQVGLPKVMIRELFQCSNLFIFPTREESFGLVVPEAALAGGVFMVLNKSLTMQMEITGFTALYFDFGSYHMSIEHENEAKWLQEVGLITVGRMQQNESIMAKTFCRKRYNWDSLYNRFYGPIMAESLGWAK